MKWYVPTVFYIKYSKMDEKSPLQVSVILFIEWVGLEETTAWYVSYLIIIANDAGLIVL